MKNFYQYLAENTNTYNYRIRTVEEIGEEQYIVIRAVLEQYDPVSVSEPVRTPLQDSPLDFPNYSMTSVFIIDAELKIPVSPYILQNKLKAALVIPDSSIVVRMDNDPMELETLRLDNFGNWDEHQPLLSTDPDYHEYNHEADIPVAYGNEYNQKFLAYLAAVKKKRHDVVTETQPENTTIKDYSILKSFDDDSALDFIKDKDGVLPVYQSEVTGDEQNPVKTAIHGNFDSISRLPSKIIKDKK